VAEDDAGMWCDGRLTDADACITLRAVTAAAAVLGLAATLAAAADTLETGANKPCSDVQVKYLPYHRPCSQHCLMVQANENYWPT